MVLFTYGPTKLIKCQNCPCLFRKSLSNHRGQSPLYHKHLTCEEGGKIHIYPNTRLELREKHRKDLRNFRRVDYKTASMEGTIMNKQLILVSYADESPLTHNHVRIKETLLDLRSVGKIGSSGDVVVQNEWVSVDPYLKWFMKHPDQSKNGLYFDSINLNESIPSALIGKVVMSANAEFEVGDVVSGSYRVAEYSIVAGSGLTKLDTNLAKPTQYLGPLGLVGLTAWAGFLLIGEPKPGDEVFVSAAAGAVGLLVGQLAKIKGCRVVGSVGTDQKVKMLKEEFGFDDAFNYKSETDWDAALSKYFPRGIDIYFDNVGGTMLEAVLNHINNNVRIPICGMISQYNQEDWKERYGVRNLLSLVGKCGKIQGFLFCEYLHQMGEFVAEMGGYMKEGKIKYKEEVKEGLESFVDAFNSIFTGENNGKILLHLTHA